MSLTLPPLSLYIHIPWCVKKCPYCDFNSHVNKSEALPETEYIKKLIQDCQQDSHWAQGRKFSSIFFGGGTPSLFSAHAIGDILNSAQNTIGFENNIEITLEANPGTFEQKKFRDFYHAGVNRLSIGVQSFQDSHLKTLGRIHSKTDAITAIESARDSGFDNFNIDLMHGLPSQTIEQATADITTAIKLAPTHISWYQLTIEPNTVFYRQPPTLPVDDTLADIQDAGQALLYDNGFYQYEVSAYSHKHKQSRHNLNYWSFGDYIGIGAGAHGKVSDIKNNTIIRTQKTRLPEHYLSNNINDSRKTNTVDAKELPLEFLMNALRLNNGVALELFSNRTGLSLDIVMPELKKLSKQGLIDLSNHRVRTTDLGRPFLNTILSSFVENN